MLQEEHSQVQEETEILRNRTDAAIAAARTENDQKKAILEYNMNIQKRDNSILQRHLQHTINSAGLSEDKANILLKNLEKFIECNDTEAEKLELAIARAKKKYHQALETRQQDLRALGIPEEEVQSLDILSYCDVN